VEEVLRLDILLKDSLCRSYSIHKLQDSNCYDGTFMEHKVLKLVRNSMTLLMVK